MFFKLAVGAIVAALSVGALVGSMRIHQQATACEKSGGTYVKVYDGYRCLNATAQTSPNPPAT